MRDDVYMQTGEDGCNVSVLTARDPARASRRRPVTATAGSQKQTTRKQLGGTRPVYSSVCTGGEGQAGACHIGDDVGVRRAPSAHLEGAASVAATTDREPLAARATPAGDVLVQ